MLAFITDDSPLRTHSEERTQDRFRKKTFHPDGQACPNRVGGIPNISGESIVAKREHVDELVGRPPEIHDARGGYAHIRIPGKSFQLPESVEREKDGMLPGIIIRRSYLNDIQS
ncbi:MAG: hypothetical protein IKQ16_09490 [Lentisphaeria bacterium]|nr:hypothetical protein [Lentisphaeria bacterium]